MAGRNMVRTAAILVVSLLLLVPATAQIRTVAVPDFVNNTGTEKLEYLSSSLSASVSATLSQLKDIQVVERGQLEKVFSEIELELSGVIDQQSVTRVGTLTEADVLILGSYAGTAEKIVLTLKAVEVESAQTIYGRVVTGTSGDIFDTANMTALVFGSVIAGREMGTLTVITRPEECDIYIDGLLVGKSPIVEYQLPSGQHRVRALKNGYEERENNLLIVSNEHKDWRVSLPQTVSQLPWTVAIAALYRYPLPAERGVVDPSLMIQVAAGYAFEWLTIEGVYTLSWPKHYQKIEFFDETFYREQSYWLHTFQIGISIAPFSLWALSPYGTLSMGLSLFSDATGDPATIIDSEVLNIYPRFLLGARLGILFFPYLRVQPFGEAQFYFHPLAVEHPIYVNEGLTTGLIQRDAEFTSLGFAFGGGIRIRIGGGGG